VTGDAGSVTDTIRCPVATIPGIDDLAMTTNGALLERKASGFAAAGSGG
jgi:molybdenum cofactor biosynthesis enzyme MoaA